MTREEAIKILEEIIDEGWLISDFDKCTAIDACEMAIKALEQEPVYYPPCIDCNKKMDEIRNAYDNMIKALEQEPFINKPCVSSGVCEHDKQKVLEKIRAEINKAQEPFMADKDYDEGVRFGLMLAHQITNKYKEESETNSEISS